MDHFLVANEVYIALAVKPWLQIIERTARLCLGLAGD
jgi:hypothetical protein